MPEETVEGIGKWRKLQFLPHGLHFAALREKYRVARAY